MKTHLLNEGCGANLCVTNEEMKSIAKCGKEVPEWAITTLRHQVTCKSCLKYINKQE